MKRAGLTCKSFEEGYLARWRHMWAAQGDVHTGSLFMQAPPAFLVKGTQPSDHPPDMDMCLTITHMYARMASPRFAPITLHPCADALHQNRDLDPFFIPLGGYFGAVPLAGYPRGRGLGQSYTGDQERSFVCLSDGTGYMHSPLQQHRTAMPQMPIADTNDFGVVTPASFTDCYSSDLGKPSFTVHKMVVFDVAKPEHDVPLWLLSTLGQRAHGPTTNRSFIQSSNQSPLGFRFISGSRCLTRVQLTTSKPVHSLPASELVWAKCWSGDLAKHQVFQQFGEHVNYRDINPFERSARIGRTAFALPRIEPLSITLREFTTTTTGMPIREWTKRVGKNNK